MGLWVYVLDDFVPIRLCGLDPFFFSFCLVDAADTQQTDTDKNMRCIQPTLYTHL